MCYPVKCRVCGKTTWGGCGQHIAQVRASVPKDQWCPGKHTPEEYAAVQKGGIFARLFGG